MRTADSLDWKISHTALDFSKYMAEASVDLCVDVVSGEDFVFKPMHQWMAAIFLANLQRWIYGRNAFYHRFQFQTGWEH